MNKDQIEKIELQKLRKAVSNLKYSIRHRKKIIEDRLEREAIIKQKKIDFINSLEINPFIYKQILIDIFHRFPAVVMSTINSNLDLMN